MQEKMPGVAVPECVGTDPPARGYYSSKTAALFVT